MKNKTTQSRRFRQSGLALITVMVISVCTAMLLGASLMVALTACELGWKQSYDQAAVELADAGINSELQFVALNVGASTVTGKSSQPVVYSGVTATMPGSSTAVLGRPGTVTGYSGGTYYVYSSNNASGTVAWDGVTSPYYITCNACVNNTWQTVQVQASSTSLFNVYGTFSTGDTSGSSGSPSITAGSGSQVNITGSSGVNGTVSQGSNCSFTAPCAINANCANHSGNQFTSSNLCSGGQLCQVQTPIVYPRTATCCGNCFGCAAGSSDATCFQACQNHCCNSSCVYTYSGSAYNDTICPQNCCQLSGGCGTQLNSSCWNNAGIHPGTYTSSSYWWWWGWQNTTAVQTLIFEPGDYYFTSMQLAYDASKEIIVDPCAYASGGTPGQVRFWFYDPNSATDGNPSDLCQMPITNTCPSGSSTPDPGQFRIYYGKDNCTCSFQRCSNICDWTGNTITGDFNYYCGIYACTKPVTDTNSSRIGCCCHFQGTPPNSGCSTQNGGKCNLCGSMLCDHLKFDGCCNCNYVQSQCCTKDPCSGCQPLSWSCSRG